MRLGNRVNFDQLGRGLFFPLIGVSVYLWIRDNALSSIPDTLVVHRLFTSTVIQITNQLPTYTHLLAFSLLTAASLRGGRRIAAKICIFWFLVVLVFEMAQHSVVSSWLLALVPYWFKNIWLLDNTYEFLSSGTYDPLDLAAALVAALLAYRIINITESNRVLLNASALRDMVTDTRRSTS
jgi:hypothetical protein